MSSHLRFLADENIPFVREAFGSYGPVRVIAGHSIRKEDVQDADVLLVRSVTIVNKELIERTPIQFIGSATIGTDHVDLNYLAEHGIAFAHAPGSNADSVAEYVLAALFETAARRSESLRGKTIGIIGNGNIGARLAERLGAFGLQVLKNDPPLAKAAGKAGLPHDFIELEDLLATADIVTLHVPLTHTGPYPTYHLINSDTFGKMKKGAWLVNTCRGNVVDNAALLTALESGRIEGAILDVWENEPAPDLRLIRQASLATPHIAGYSYDGKIQGTLMVYEAFLSHAGLKPLWNAGAAFTMTPEDRTYVAAPDPALPEVRWFNALLRRLYDIAADDARMRAIPDLPENERGGYFNSLRKHYPRRRTFNRHILPERAIPDPYLKAIRNGIMLRVGSDAQPVAIH
jgi:erythronate-4-phosphate dehydrogenase